MSTIIAKRHHSSVSNMAQPPQTSPNSSSVDFQSAAAAAAAATMRPSKRRRQDCSDAPSPSALPMSQPQAAAPTKKKRVRKQVTFAAKPSINIVPSWTPSESALSWYTALDVAFFKLQEGTDAALLRHLISKASCVSQLPQESSLYRGLERLLSPQIVREIKERRRGVVKNVLVEQARQRSVRSGSSGSCSGDGKEVSDEMKLAEVSRCCSEKGAVWARNLASLV